MAKKSSKKTGAGTRRNTTKLQELEAKLRQANGATITELTALLGWQPHSVRGAISNLKRKRNLKISAEDVQGGERIYRIPN